MLLTGIPWDPENVIFFKGLTKDAENNDVTKSLEKFNDFFKREKLWDMTTKLYHCGLKESQSVGFSLNMSPVAW